MKELNITIFDSKLGTWLVCFTHPFTKKKIRKSFKNKLKAQDYKESIKSHFLISRIQSFNNLNIEDALILFSSENPNNIFSKKNTHLIDFYETFKGIKVLDLTTDALKIWLDQVQKENKVKDITMRGIKCDIDTLFAFLEEKEIISKSPLKEIFYEKSTPSVESRNLLSPQELLELIREVKAYSPGYLYPMVKLLSETACKSSEVIGLLWQDLDLDRQLISFKKRAKIQERQLFISDELTKALRLLKSNSKSESVFKTYYKESFTTTKLTRAINDFKKQSNFKKNWSPMDLRHSYAINFLTEGGSLRRLQKILGHNNVYDTKRLYEEASQELIKRNASKIAL